MVHPLTQGEWESAGLFAFLGVLIFAHRRMQWHSVLGLSSPEELCGCYEADTAIGRKWKGQDPPTGAMEARMVDTLCRILAVQTADPQHCYFGLCTIESWLDSFSGEELKPLLRLPFGREYIVLSGPLTAVAEISRGGAEGPSGWQIAPKGNVEMGELSPVDWVYRGTPNLIWPADDLKGPLWLHEVIGFNAFGREIYRGPREECSA